MTTTIKPAVVHYASFPEALADGARVADTLLSIARDPFFRAVELGEVPNAADRRRVREIARQSGLEVGYSVQPAQLSKQLSLCATDEDSRRSNVAAVVGYIEEAHYLGASALSILSGTDPGPALRPEAVRSLVKSVSELCTAAADCGMQIWLESFDRDIDRRMLVGPAILAAQIAAAVRRQHANFGLMIDFSHTPLLGETPGDALRAVKPYLSRVHVGNCVKTDPHHARYGDTHPAFGTPGGVNGISELASFLEECIAVGYLRPGAPQVVTLEVRPGVGEDPGLVLAGAKRALSEAWAAVASAGLHTKGGHQE